MIIAGIFLGYKILSKTKSGQKLFGTWPFQILKFFWQGFVGVQLFTICVFGLQWWAEYVLVPGFNMDPSTLLKVYKVGIETSFNLRG